MSAVSLEIDFEALKLDTTSHTACPDSEFLYAPLNYLQSRPIVNPGNRCYMIAVLQVLLHTRLFSNYLQKYFFKLEMAEAVLEDNDRFPLLCALKHFYRQFTTSTANTTAAVSHDVIDDIFLALKLKNSFVEAGFAEQEDAEEFLTALLDSLGEEFSAIQAQKLLSFALPFETVTISSFTQQQQNDDSDDWLQVGPKQRVATTRRTPVNLSPIHTLFAGSFQSLYRSPGTRPSITFEPFTILPLSLVTMTRERGDLSAIESIEGAIEQVLRCEELDRKCSKQLSFASLPPVLIIQLKRFIYRNATKNRANELELHKITKALRIPRILTLQSSNNSNSTFKLYAAVNHHGSSLHAGHYTATIAADDDDSGWQLFDDDVKVQKVKEDHLLFNQNTSAYLLFYERQQ